MKEKILELVYNYTCNYKFIDKNFIESIIEILVDYYNVENDELKDLNLYDNLLSDSLGSYNTNSKILSINIAKVNLSSQRQNIIFRSYIDKYSFIHLYAIQIILHEFYHLFQERERINLKSTNKNSDILKLLEYSSLLVSEEIRKKYNCLDLSSDIYSKYYEFFPDERMAEINSYSDIIELINLDKTFNEQIKSYYIYKLMEAKSYAYFKTDNLEVSFSPAQKYLYKIDYYNLYKTFSFYDDKYEKCLKKVKRMYPIDERILYGFPLDNEEKIELFSEFNRAVRSGDIYGR